MFNQEILSQYLENNDSFYIYEKNGIIKSIEKLQNNFPDICFLYSLKTNPNKEVLDTIFAKNVGADAASLGEVMLSHERNVPIECLQYSAPGKTRAEIEKAFDISTLIADSLNEINLIQEIAKEKNIVKEIGVRLNPNFTFFASNGIASKFGIDEQQFFENINQLTNLSHVKIVGIHVHSRSQELNINIIYAYYENLFNLLTRAQEALNSPLKFVNMGSGIGITYSLEDSPLDVENLGKKTIELIKKHRENFPQMKIYIETGRYLVGKNGFYISKVLDYKTSYGKKFVILANTLNGFVRPSIAKLIESYSKEETLFATEPLFTCKNAFPLYTNSKSTEKEVVNLVGNLCTAADIVAQDVLLPKLDIGDAIIITNAGSYAAVLSPMQFSTQVAPKEIFVDKFIME